VHWLRDGGRSARKLETRFEGENGAEALPAPDPATTEP
jgi:hypothetical protein